MEKQSTISVIEFIASQNLVNQTLLVDSILKADKNFDLYNNIYNLYLYRVKLSKGIFSGTVNQHSQKTHQMEQTLNYLKKQVGRLHHPNPSINKLDHIHESIEQLEWDLHTLGNADGKERHIFEWWLIPYWLSEMLIEKQQVVFRCYDCNWWGRTTYKRPINRDNVLKDIIQSLKSKK